LGVGGGGDKPGICPSDFSKKQKLKKKNKTPNINTKI
jgi:hypothetical protein